MIQEARKCFKTARKEGYRHWAISFSGGKDSLTVLILALETALEISSGVERLDVIYNDSTVECPPMHQWTLNFLERLKGDNRFAALPLHIHIVKPLIKELFWSRVLGERFPPPQFDFRWCGNTKIAPITRKLKELKGPQPFAQFLGQRLSESREKKKRLLSKPRKPNIFFPILSWDVSDVWEFLDNIAPHWGYQVEELHKLYGPDEKVRFGCWCCTLVRRDRGMEHLISIPRFAYLKPLVEFHDYLWAITRSPWIICKTREARPDGLPGKLHLRTCKDLLRQLLKVQIRVGIELISPETIAFIKEKWRTKT